MTGSNTSIIDTVAIGVIAGAWLQIIPAAAAVFAILWYMILIWESDTVRGWTGRQPKTQHSDYDGEV